jgi:hypothetical protein
VVNVPEMGASAPPEPIMKAETLLLTQFAT